MNNPNPHGFDACDDASEAYDDMAAFEASVRADYLWEVTEAMRAVNNLSPADRLVALRLLATVERAHGAGCATADIVVAKEAA